MTTLVLTHVAPSTDNQSVLLAWSIRSPDSSSLSSVVFSVDRSGASSGPWETIANSVSSPFFEDVSSGSVNLISLRREIWYRVRATLANMDEVTSQAMSSLNAEVQTYAFTQPVGLTPTAGDHHAETPNLFEGRTALDKRLALVGRAVRRYAAINLRMFVGVPCALLKRKHFGPRCECYNPDTNTSRSSKCTKCYGTTYDGGYWTPILIDVRITPAPRQTSIQPEGTSSIQQAQVELVSYPALEQDDIIVEFSTGKRWVVQDKMRHASLHRTEITQHWTCSELSRAASAYRVPVDRATLYAQDDVIKVRL